MAAVSNENPRVFALIEKYAMEAIKVSYQHYAIKTLLSVCVGTLTWKQMMVNLS